MTSNTILATDSYKASHWLQFPPGTQIVHCYIESRGGRYDRTVFFGLQAFLRRYLGHPITQADIDEAAEFFAAHGEPFNREGWEHILAVHGGRLPVEIKAAPEGLAIDTHNVLLTIVNTDPSCFWLPNYLETALLRAIWYPTTVCTVSFHCKIAILQALAAPATYRRRTIPAAFKLHDFGARGATSQESAGAGRDGASGELHGHGHDRGRAGSPALLRRADGRVLHPRRRAQHHHLLGPRGRGGRLPQHAAPVRQARQHGGRRVGQLRPDARGRDRVGRGAEGHDPGQRRHGGGAAG